MYEIKSKILQLSGEPRSANIGLVDELSIYERFNLKKITLALIIAQPGHLRNGLQSLLRSIPKIEVIAESHDPSILMKMSDDIHPDVIIIDACVIEEMNWNAIETIKADWPNTRILVLTDVDQQGKRAIEAGADFSLPKGFPAAELVKLIEKALLQDFVNQ